MVLMEFLLEYSKYKLYVNSNYRPRYSTEHMFTFSYLPQRAILVILLAHSVKNQIGHRSFIGLKAVWQG